MKLRIITYIILTVFIAGTVNATSLTQQADSAYMQDNFAKATELYLKIAAEEGDRKSVV